MPCKGICPNCGEDEAIYWVNSEGDLYYYCPSCDDEGRISEGCV